MLPAPPSSVAVGPLTAILVDPSSVTHVKQLTEQRILCGWAAESVPLWLEGIRDATRLQFLYYETATNLPIGASAVNTLEQYGGRTLGSLPASQRGIRSTSIDPSARGKNFGNYMFEHMHAVGFSDPKVEEMVIDTMTTNVGMRAWVQRMGYVEDKVVPCFDEGKVAPHMLADEPEGGYMVVLYVLSRQRWKETTEAKGKVIGGPVQAVKKSGSGAFPPLPVKYTAEQALKLMEDNLRYLEMTK